MEIAKKSPNFLSGDLGGFCQLKVESLFSDRSEQVFEAG